MLPPHIQLLPPNHQLTRCGIRAKWFVHDLPRFHTSAGYPFASHLSPPANQEIMHKVYSGVVQRGKACNDSTIVYKLVLSTPQYTKKRTGHHDTSLFKNVNLEIGELWSRDWPPWKIEWSLLKNIKLDLSPIKAR